MTQVRVLGFTHLFVQFIIPGHCQKVCAIQFPYVVEQQSSASGGWTLLKKHQHKFLQHNTPARFNIIVFQAGVLPNTCLYWDLGQFGVCNCPGLCGDTHSPSPQSSSSFYSSQKARPEVPCVWYLSTYALQHIQAYKWVMKYRTCRNL